MNMRRSRGGNEPVQFAASFPADDEDFAPPRKSGGGIGRIVAVVVLMHVVFIGGFAAFKKIGHDEPVATTATSKTEKEDVKAASANPDVDEALAPIDLAEKRIIVDHPTMKGFSRYRVSAGEQLAEVARQFNASVAEIERLNDLKSGKPLRVGQWLTVPGSATGPVLAKNETAPSTSAPVTASAQTTTTKEATTSPMRATVITEGKEPAKPAAPTPRVVEVKPAPVTLKPVPIAPEPKPRPIANTPAPRPTVATSGAPGRTYTVLSGDTAYRIALKHGVQWQELLAHNGMKDPLELKAGQTLRIP